jgi:hypothetical protein
MLQVDRESRRVSDTQESQAEVVEDSFFETRAAIHRITPNIRGTGSSPIISTERSAQNPETEPRSDLTPKRRLRHDDSQIQFIAVESSPAIVSGPQSQHLTARQKEVKERQCNETSRILEGIGSSSPRLPSPTEAADLYNMSQLPDPAVQEIPLTPSLPATVLENDDVFPGSSPTPSAKLRGQINQGGDTSSMSIRELEAHVEPDIPSSPPEANRVPPKSRGTSRRRRKGNFNPISSGDGENTIEPRQLRSWNENVSPSNIVISEDGDGPNDAESVVLDVNDLKPLGSSDAITCKVDNDGVDDRLPNQSSDGDVNPASGELELQLASQLRHSLELAVDLDEIGSTHAQPGLVPPRTRKRKREQEKQLASLAEKRRRFSRSLRMVTRSSHKELSVKVGEAERSFDSGSDDQSTENAPSSPKTSKADREASSKLLSQPSTPERPGETDEQTPPPKKRRSSRLNGDSVNVEGIPKKRRATRSGNENSEMSNPESAASLSQSRERATAPVEEQARSTRKAAREAALKLLTNGIAKPVVIIDLSDERQAAAAPDSDTDSLPDTEETHQSNDLQTTYVMAAAQTDEVSRDGADTDVEPTATSVLASLRRVLASVRGITLGRETLREMDDLMFDIRFEAHSAVRQLGN